MVALFEEGEVRRQFDVHGMDCEQRAKVISEVTFRFCGWFYGWGEAGKGIQEDF